MWPMHVHVRATINRSRDVTSDFGPAESRHEDTNDSELLDGRAVGHSISTRR